MQTLSLDLYWNLYTIDVCVDCYLTHHYPNEHTPESDRTPWESWPGLVQNGEVADNVNMDEERGFTSFTWADCEGCGSRLGGARYEMCVWQPTELAIAMGKNHGRPRLIDA